MCGIPLGLVQQVSTEDGEDEVPERDEYYAGFDEGCGLPECIPRRYVSESGLAVGHLGRLG